MQGDQAMIKEEVDAEDIADVVSRWTGIPVSKLLQSEKENLLHLEDELQMCIRDRHSQYNPGLYISHPYADLL